MEQKKAIMEVSEFKVSEATARCLRLKLMIQDMWENFDKEWGIQYGELVDSEYKECEEAFMTLLSSADDMILNSIKENLGSRNNRTII